MPDIRKLDAEAQEYFNSLPKNIQVSIMMSDAHVTSRHDLEVLYNDLTQTNNCNGRCNNDNR